MLVLSRKKHERIFVDVPADFAGGRIELAVVDIRGDKVRVGILADERVVILRAELEDAAPTAEGVAA